ncbi:chitinase [Mycolicibacterium porcinum]|nr:chitinase [Mycolicibacterium vulneris]ODR26530.1 chitinase [Mycolicibacterium porcinum]
MMVLLHVCETDSPGGKSNSSLQSLIGTVLVLVMMKRAMKPVCHVDVTDNVATGTAA